MEYTDLGISVLDTLLYRSRCTASARISHFFLYFPSLLSPLGPLAYTCTGAIDKIFPHFFFLSSEPTTPVSLVPTGSPDLFMSTQALSSKRATLPSGRWLLYFVRTMTACRMSPRLTRLTVDIPASTVFRCFWTTTTTRSPIIDNRQVNAEEAEEISRTYSCVSFLAEDQCALNECSPRVVDAIEDRLSRVS
jgi:hypothetical protein